ncbi:MAG TPA: hypothetical protein VK488_11280 [Gaiellaceae bacterium]|nr:hypothetical protein [Gaiellaceae bacterium]
MPYEFGAAESGFDLINVGWLEATEPFTVADVESEFVARLAKLCRNGVNQTRGFHRCSLCGRTAENQLPEPTRVHSSAGDYLVGSAEIRVRGRHRVVYASPDMIVHYVTAHRYRPPDYFIQAVLESRGAEP